MDIVGRIQAVENEKEQRQQTLVWEHLPPIDPALVAAAMQRIRDRISVLEDRKRALLQEQEDLIVGAVIRGRQGD